MICPVNPALAIQPGIRIAMAIASELAINGRCHRTFCFGGTKLNAFIECFRSLCRLPRRLRRGSDKARLSDEDIAAALDRGRIAAATEPRAIGVRYDAQTDRIIIQLKNGSTIEASPREIQGLETATPEQLADVKILGRGSGIRWERLDVDVSVPGLAAGILGTRLHGADCG
jgi:hypothetical protein